MLLRSIYFLPVFGANRTQDWMKKMLERKEKLLLNIRLF
jgi:uncharacterized protein YpbB